MRRAVLSGLVAIALAIALGGGAASQQVPISPATPGPATTCAGSSVPCVAVSGVPTVAVSNTPLPFVNSSGAVSPVQCDQTAYNTTGSGQLITSSGSTKIYICSIVMSALGTGVAIYGKYGTGTVCGTGGVNLFEFYGGTQFVLPWGNGLGAILTIPANQNFCFGTAGTITNDSISVNFAQL